MAGIRKNRLEQGKPLLFPNVGKRKTLEDFDDFGGGLFGNRDRFRDRLGGRNGEEDDTGAGGDGSLTDPDATFPMPDPGDERRRAEQRRLLRLKRSAGGRESTVMSPHLQDMIGTRRVI